MKGWKARCSTSRRRKRVEHMANNLSQTNTRLQKELLSCGPSQKPILAYYVEWCETPCTKTPGVCFDDACIVYDDTVSVSGNTGNYARRVIAHVRKTPLNNIYLRIRNNLLDPYEEAAMNRLKLYIQQTFWGNESAWECMLSAMSLAMRGYNVDRCFWTVGPGGVGQSLLPHHLNAVFRPSTRSSTRVCTTQTTSSASRLTILWVRL